MKKIENENDNYSNFLEDDDEIIVKKPTNNDASDNTEAVETSRAKEPEEPEYTIVAENAKMKIVLCIVAVVVILIIILLINAGISKTQKSHIANENDFSTSVTEITEQPSEASTDISETDITEQTTQTTKKAPVQYNLFGRWKIDGTSSTLDLKENNGTFKYYTKVNDDTLVFSGKAKAYIGEAAATMTGYTMEDIYYIFHIDKKDFDNNCLYYVECNAEQYQKNNEPAVKIDTSQDVEEGGPVFAHLIYINKNDKGETVAEYYDETSTVGLFQMTLVKE